jgi:hypothetical protein
VIGLGPSPVLAFGFCLQPFAFFLLLPLSTAYCLLPTTLPHLASGLASAALSNGASFPHRLVIGAWDLVIDRELQPGTWGLAAIARARRGVLPTAYRLLSPVRRPLPAFRHWIPRILDPFFLALTPRLPGLIMPVLMGTIAATGVRPKSGPRPKEGRGDVAGKDGSFST